jgi:hypothetical protein
MVIEKLKYRVFLKEDITSLVNYKDHRRLKVFYEKGCKCAFCGVEGTQILHSIDNHGNTHIDIFTDSLILMTVDHIIPKSRGGAYDISNLQPLCRDCNTLKADKMNGDIITIKTSLEKQYTFKVGDPVYKKTTDEFLGNIIEILPNPYHPKNLLSCKTSLRDKASLYILKALYTIKSEIYETPNK